MQIPTTTINPRGALYLPAPDQFSAFALYKLCFEQLIRIMFPADTDLRFKRETRIRLVSVTKLQVG